MKPVQVYNVVSATGSALPNGRRGVVVNDVFQFDLEETLAAMLGSLLLEGDAGGGLDGGTVDVRVWSGGSEGKSAPFLGGLDAAMTMLGAPERSMVILRCATVDDTAALAEALGAKRPSPIPESVIRYWNADNLNRVDLDVLGFDAVVGDDPLELVGLTEGVYDATGGPGGAPCVSTAGGAYFQALFSQTQPYGVALVLSNTAAAGVAADGGVDQTMQMLWDAFQNGVYAGGGGTLSTSLVPPVGWYLFSAWLNGNSSEIRLNGVSIATGGGGSPGTAAPNGFTLGARASGVEPGNARYAHAGMTNGADGLPGLEAFEAFLLAATGL